VGTYIGGNPMRILFDMGHPGHVHLFKNTINSLKKDCHDVKITARNKEVTQDLLTAYGFEYEDRGKIFKGILNKAFGMFQIDLKLFFIAKKFQPDILIGVNNPYVAHVGAVLRKPVIIFNDTENVPMARLITYPFVQAILTPMHFREHVDPKKHIKIQGFKELAYLHPNYFFQNPHVLEELGLLPNEKFIIVRFVSWGATHDIGHHGINDKIGLVKVLETYGRVLLTSEGDPPPELKPYLIKIPPEKLHNLLFYATLYVGEGATMASEAAVLGTPSIYVSSLAGRFGNFIELEETYDLLYSFTDGNAALGKAIEILQNKKSKEDWMSKRELMLKDKIDVTAFIVWFIENYPKSFEDLKNHVES
jgi:predicted glycosyltransferase